MLRRTGFVFAWVVLCCGLVPLACGGEPAAPDLDQRQAALGDDGEPGAMPLVFDSDMDFDDTAALAYLAQAHKQGRIELRAVTVTNDGAGLPGQGLLHARCLLARFGITDVPVADGSNQGTNPFPAFVRFLIDTIISDTLADCPLTPEPSAVSAPELIAAQVRAARRPLTILATGPLTNVAAALDTLDHPTLEGRLAGVVSMGGAVHLPGGLLAPDPNFDGTQEVNYWADPQGTERVYDLVPGGKITMVSDATHSVPITFAFLDRLAAAAHTAEAGYVNALMSHPFVQAGLASGQPAFWWDPLAATSALETGKKIIDYERDRIDIIVDGPSAGRTLAVRPNEPGVWTRVAIRADQARFETHFLDVLNGSGF